MRRMSKLQQIRNHPHSKESGSVRIFLCVYVCARSCLSIWGWKNQTSWAEDNGSPPMGGQSKTDYLLQSRFVKGSQSWIFIGRIDVEAETLILWPPDAKSWLIWKDPDAGKDWRWEEKEMTEKEMVGWHHWLSGHGFGWTLVGDGQGGLACCSPWGRKASDTAEQLNWTELNWGTWVYFLGFLSCCSSVQFSCSVMADSLQPHGLHSRLPCPSPTPGAYKNMSIESMMPSSHLILCCPLLLLHSIFPSIRVFSNESILCIR